MNINAGIIDQQVSGVVQRLRGEIEAALGKPLDDVYAHSVGFVVLCAKLMLDVDETEAVDLLTEGGNDFGVDAIKIGDVTNYQFTVTLIQAKYEHKHLEGNRNFPQSGVEKAVQAVQTLFDPHTKVTVNPRLRAQVEEIRSLINDGNMPRVHVLLCNNGLRWKEPESGLIIERANLGRYVTFDHVNHETLVGVVQATQPINEHVQFVGKSLWEDMRFVRVFVGKVAVSELERLVERYGDSLLDRNIRRYLGLRTNRVNEAIFETLRDDKERPNFYFYNNGLTLICDKFEFNALQGENHKVRIEGLQIINGGQTTMTVHEALKSARSGGGFQMFDDAHVLVRLYQVSQGEGPDVPRITYAVNSQNPVDLRDLRSNDPAQRKLETDMAHLGYRYRRQRGGETSANPTEISTATAAEAVLSVWRQKPQQARFRSGEHFGKLYADIFTNDLNGSQVILAVLLFRIAENKRKRPPEDALDLVRYGSCFAAMLMGRYLLSDMGLVRAGDLDHRNFKKAEQLVHSNGETYFERAVGQLDQAINQLYGNQDIGLQRLSATFRRGDLHQYLGGAQALLTQ